MRFFVITLGCDKNTVDSERIAADLVGHGGELAPDPEGADVVIVNTCGFIDAAKEESIDTLLEAARLKDTGSLSALVAVGCLVERHRRELARSLPEVDLFLGTRDLPQLVPQLLMRGLLDARERRHPGGRLPVGGQRHVSYLKVSEGCDHKCAFCAIPLWRGRHRSFEPDALVAEARALESRGVVELNLVAQDLAHYGRDVAGGAGLHGLIERILAETSIPWVRLLYIYSAGLRPSLVELMATEDRLLSYIDMPIQHASAHMLKLMRRPERPDRLRQKIARLRSEIPDLALRTTVVVGFPGEREEDFEELLDFMGEVGFDHLGAFAYSPQAGTTGAEMPDPVPESLKMERLVAVNELQRSMVAARLRAQVGREVEVIIDRVADLNGNDHIEARARHQAYGIDGLTYLSAPGLDLTPGDLALVRVTGSDDADQWASAIIRERVAAPRVGYDGLLPLDLRTAWGR